MISVCIPIYNHYTYPLVRRLSNQIGNLKGGEEVEIVCIDNHSSGYYLNQNMGICDIATYLRLADKITPARLHRLFLKHAKGDWFIFLDSDSVLPSNYIRSYLPHLYAPNQVVVGGRHYDNRGNDNEHRLCYHYGSRHEGRPADERARSPYRSFSTCNFAISRSALESIRIAQPLLPYGHEDILMAHLMEQQKIPVLHIDNPVTKGYVETNAEFLHNATSQVDDLVHIYNLMWEDQRFCHNTPILNTYATVRRWKMVPLVNRLLSLAKPLMEAQFARGSAFSLKQFNFYLLGTFIRRINQPDGEADVQQAL